MAGNSKLKGNGAGVEGNGSEFIDPTTILGGTGNGNNGGSDGSIVRDATGATFDPSIHSDPDKRNSDGSFRRKRGRKGGSGSQRSSKVQPDLGELVQMLSGGMVMFHAAMATATNVPELVLSVEEAESLSKSGITFLEQFDVKPNPKVTAGLIFMGNVAAIYGTRYAAIRMRLAQEKAERKKGTAGIYTPEGFAAGTTDFTVQEPSVQ